MSELLTTRIRIRLSEADWRALEALAAERGKTPSAILRDLIRREALLLPPQARPAEGSHEPRA